MHKNKDMIDSEVKKWKGQIQKCPKCGYTGYQNKFCKNCGERLHGRYHG